jgi:peptidoglycan LD-endopeptidase CwlK
MVRLVLPPRSDWTFGSKSEAELAGVSARLQAVARLALATCFVDFGIHDGMRTDLEHAANQAAGTTRAERSRHQDGLAVDAVPWVRGEYTWGAAQCYRVARAYQDAARFLRIPIVWGGVWDRTLNELGRSLETEHTVYCERYELQNPGKKPLVDLVHFELAEKKQ